MIVPTLHVVTPLRTPASSVTQSVTGCIPTRSVRNDPSPHIRFCAQRVGVRLADDGLRSGPNGLRTESEALDSTFRFVGDLRPESKAPGSKAHAP